MNYLENSSTDASYTYKQTKATLFCKIQEGWENDENKQKEAGIGPF